MHKLAVYVRLFRSQLRDRNAEHPLPWRERIRRGHRLATAALVVLRGPPYKAPHWMR
jgi:hypothetical protein